MVLVSTLFISFSPLQLRGAGSRTLPGHVPAVAKQLTPTERLDPNLRLELAIGVPLRNREALTNFLQELYDPGSAQYRQYLTPERFTELFGPSPEDYQAVIEFAEASGFTVTRTHSNRVLLDVNASVADIEKAFHVTMHVYQHPSENRTFYAPDLEPSVDLSVPILDISGLNNFSLPRPLVHKQTDSSTRVRPLLGAGPGGTYRGGDFRAAYAPGILANGTGQSVGLLEFDGYYANDITSYESQSGLPNVPLSNVLLDSFNGSPGNNNVEVALDIELAIAMAPGLNQVIVYEAGPNGFPNDILNRMATDNQAKCLSSSWSWSGGASSDSIFQQLAAQGQSFFQASGDSDAYSSTMPQPVDSPYITIVGGTTLTTSGPGGSWTSETTWNWANTGSGTSGSGGGISTTYTIPTWQQGISMTANMGSTTMRNIPDVALTADNIWVVYNNGSSGAFGGTSCAAPLWAGYAALINQQAIANGQSTVGFINPAIYSIGKGASYKQDFHDITTGNNTNSSSPTKFYAVSGFDLATGWGTPAGSSLFNALAGAPAPQIVSNSLSLVSETCSNNAVDPGEIVTMNFGLINSGTANTVNLTATLLATGGVTAPSAPQTYGVLAGGGSAVSRPFSFTASGACGAVITATLQLQDNSVSLGTVTFTIRLGNASIVTTVSESFDSVATPALPSNWTATVLSGFDSAWATTNGLSDTAPNSAFVPDAISAGETSLLSPIIPINSTSAQLTFRQNLNLALRTTSHPRSTNYYDGGVLEISIGGGAFTGILAAGGSFTTGGYNCTLTGGTGNPLAGSQAWGGNSGGWLTTTVVLPAAAAGQNVQLRWSLGTGVNTSAGAGWFVDSITLQDTIYQCCSPNADVGVSQSSAPNPGMVGQNLSYTLSIVNSGALAASSVTFTDALPANVTFMAASPGCINLGGSIACSIGTLAGGAQSNIVITVKPNTTGTITNSAKVSTTTADSNLANNVSINTTTVFAAPSISSEPTNQVVTAGAAAGFYVIAAGSAPLAYQWTFGGTRLAGATTSNLNLANVQTSQAGNYAVVVTNGAGSTTSTVATLTVLVPPSITVQPTNLTGATGAKATFQVGANGTAPLSYQWSFNNSPIVGATTNTLVLNNVQTNAAGDYSVAITNAVGAVTSAVASLTVLVPPSITVQPTNQTVLVGNAINFQATATGSAPLSYQWLLSGAVLPGATTSSLTLNNVQTNQAGAYSLRVTNSVGSITSSVAQLTVLVPPYITGQPTNQTTLVGGNVSFAVTAAGTSPLGYQWWFNGTNAVGTSTNLLTLTNVQTNQEGIYSVRVTNVAGSVTSSVVTLIIGTPPSITQQPSSQQVSQGQDATFNVAVSGDSPLSYQWRFNGAVVSAGTTSTYTVAAATAVNAGNYDVIVSNPYGAITSAVAQLAVLVPPSITSQPSNQTVTAGGTVKFVVTAAGTSPLGYQWWFNGTNAVGTSTNLLTLPNAQTNQAGTYSVTITNVAGAVTSSVAMLIVGTPPSITQQPFNQQVVQGQDATFDVAVSGDSPLSYQWRFNGSPVSTTTANSYTVTAATAANAGNYDVIVGNPYGAVTSAVAQLAVLVPPSITSQPTNQSVAAGSLVTFQVTAVGSTPLTYQWLFNGTNTAGSNTNQLTLANIQTNQAGTYSVVVTNAAGAVTSSPAILTIGTPPLITQQPSGATIVQGKSASFTVVANANAPLSYQWRFNGTPVGNATTNTYTVTTATTANGGNYDVIISDSYGTTTSAPAVLRVLVPPTITRIQASPSTVSVSVSSLSGLTYRLEYKNNLNDPAWTAASPWVPASGGTLVLQDTNALPASRFYRVNCE
jgi:uncharacterized repeat protein (TIGR01451 family)